MHFLWSIKWLKPGGQEKSSKSEVHWVENSKPKSLKSKHAGIHWTRANKTLRCFILVYCFWMKT